MSTWLIRISQEIYLLANSTPSLKLLENIAWKTFDEMESTLEETLMDVVLDFELSVPTTR